MAGKQPLLGGSWSSWPTERSKQGIRVKTKASPNYHVSPSQLHRDRMLSTPGDTLTQKKPGAQSSHVRARKCLGRWQPDAELDWELCDALEPFPLLTQRSTHTPAPPIRGEQLSQIL